MIRFEIRYADGKKEIANVEGERALIGNGAHCDVRLPLDQAASEHVGVEVVGGTVRLESKAFEPPATVNGLPFTNMPISPDVPLTIGTTRIFIAIGDGAVDGPVVRKSAEQTSPLMKVLGMLVLVAGAYMLLTPDDAPVTEAPSQAVELFPTVRAGPGARARERQVRHRRGQARKEPLRAQRRRPGRGPVSNRGGVLQSRRRCGARGGGDAGCDAAEHGHHAGLPRPPRATRAHARRG
jgi:hypothetical protein